MLPHLAALLRLLTASSQDDASSGAGQDRPYAIPDIYNYWHVNTLLRILLI